MSETLFEKEWAAAEKAAEELRGEKRENPPKPVAQKASAPAPKGAPATQEDAAGGEEPSDEPEDQSDKPDEDSKVEDKRKSAVSVEERIRFREEKRKLKEERAAASKWLEDERAKLVSEGKLIADARRAIEAGDFDALAKAIGKSNWNELNKEVLQHFQDPNYKEVRALRERLERQEREREEREKAEQARQAQESDTRAQAEYKAGLSKQLKASENPILQLGADDPEFVAAIFEVQKREYDNDTRSTISVDDAVAEVLDSIRSSPLSKLRKRLLVQLIRDEEEAAQSGNSEDPETDLRARGVDIPEKKPMKKSVTQAGATEAAARKPGKFSHDEWRKASIRELERAFKSQR